MANSIDPPLGIDPATGGPLDNYEHYQLPDEFALNEHDLMRILPARYHVAVLSEVAPHIGGTWEPITAPGVTEYPEGR